MKSRGSTPGQLPTLPLGSSGTSLWMSTLGFFVLALVLFGALYSSSPLLYDTDSYYHLTVARAQLQDGVGHAFPWVRFGPLARHFGDKEVLFHLFLTPFLALFGPLLGGRIGLAVLDALVFATFGHLALRAWGRGLGKWGVLVPLWVVFGSTEVTWRLARLRPETFSILLLVLALWFAGRRRYRLVGLLSAIYALSYVAIHAFVGVFVLLFLLETWIEKRPPWPLLAYCLLGSGIGLIVHPDFPANLVVIWFVAVEFFRFKAVTDVGTEIRSNLTSVMLLANLGWWLGLATLWRCTQGPEEGRIERGQESSDYDRLARAFGVGTICFVALYALMSRFSLYAFPLFSLWFVLERCRAQRVPSAWLQLPGRGRIPTGVAVAICMLVAGWVGSQELTRYRARTNAGPDQILLSQHEAFSAALPDGAKIVAPWGTTARYMFWAPQGRYLNVLDPGFLAWTDPEAHRLQREILGAREPDVPLSAKVGLDSDYIAHPVATMNPALMERLENDPRAQALHRANDVLFGFRPAPPETFVLDWAVKSSVGRLAYPRLGDPKLRALEGYVNLLGNFPGGPDSQAFRAAPCFTLEYSGTERRGGLYEFSPFGPSSLSSGDRLLAALPGSGRAILGRGVLVEIASDAWARLRVETCPAPGGAGFYLARRPQPMPSR